MHQPHRARLRASGLCRSCEMPLLDEELAADATNCGVCRAAGLPEGGRTSRDREHARRGRASGHVARESP